MLKKLLTFVICLMFLSSIANAWKAGYGYRKKITIQGANLDANVTHFPLLIYIVDGDIDDHCDDDGDRSFDILFTQSDDTTLDVNWEDYSEAGGNATIIAWVSDAGWTIQSDGTTFIYLYYGNAAAGDPGTDTGVWDANFMAVWHMADVDTSTIADSTANGNTGNKGGANDPVEDTGKIYKAQDFDQANSEYIDCGDSADWDSLAQATLECWVYPTDLAGGTEKIIANLDSDDNDSGISLHWFGDDLFFSYVDDNNIRQVQVAFTTTGAWTYLCGRALGTGNKSKFTINVATTEDDENQQSNIENSADNMIIGANADIISRYFDGKVSEARLSNTARADAWVEFTYHNVFQGDNELTWAGEESAPADGFVPKVIIIR